MRRWLTGQRSDSRGQNHDRLSGAVRSLSDAPDAVTCCAAYRVRPLSNLLCPVCHPAAARFAPGGDPAAGRRAAGSSPGFRRVRRRPPDRARWSAGTGQGPSGGTVRRRRDQRHSGRPSPARRPAPAPPAATPPAARYGPAAVRRGRRKWSTAVRRGRSGSVMSVASTRATSARADRTVRAVSSMRVLSERWLGWPVHGERRARAGGVSRCRAGLYRARIRMLPERPAEAGPALAGSGLSRGAGTAPTPWG